MKFLLVLCALVVVCAAAPRAQRSYEKELEAILEELREKMEDGIPALGVPPLDPYRRKELDLDLFVESNLDAQVTFRNISMTGLKKFQLNSISLDLSTLKLSCSIKLPLLEITTSNYTLDGLLFEDTPLFGNGTADIQVNNMELEGSFTLKETNGSLAMTSFDIDITIASVQTNIENLQGGGEVGDALNVIISENLPDIVISERDFISNVIGNFAMDFSNPFLSTLSLQDLIDFIEGTTPLPRL